MTRRATRPLPDADPAPELTPGNTAWAAVMTASKVAAVAGVSPWDSPLSVWHLLAGDIPPHGETAATTRGHRLEAALLAWWRDDNPNLTLTSGVTYRHRGEPWRAATPDGVAWHRTRGPVALVEAKTDAGGGGWGAAGTSEIPLHYAAQVQWQMDVTGVHHTTVVVLGPRLEFDVFEVPYDSDAAAALRREAIEFIASVEEGRPPPIDDSIATYTTLRELHPDIDRDLTVTIDDQTADEVLAAGAARRVAERGWRHAAARLAALMGDARTAVTTSGQPIARRQPGPAGTPYVKLT